MGGRPNLTLTITTATRLVGQNEAGEKRRTEATQNRFAALPLSCRPVGRTHYSLTNQKSDLLQRQSRPADLLLREVKIRTVSKLATVDGKGSANPGWRTPEPPEEGRERQRLGGVAAAS
jgi:hypothetical protein